MNMKPNISECHRRSKILHCPHKRRLLFKYDLFPADFHTMFSYIFLLSSCVLGGCYLPRSLLIHCHRSLICVRSNQPSFPYPFSYTTQISHVLIAYYIVLCLHSSLKYSFLTLEFFFFRSNLSFVG